MKSIISIASLATIIATAGLASGCASDPTAVADKDPTRIICRNEAETGSRLPKRTCMEAREWEAMAEEAAQLKRNMDRGTVDGLSSPSGSGN